ncbi:hypothetical protein AAVH_06761 [Aphelenchoides avenae]|nr:hypothetical protein AAVH_06761 [Aphelenchus avenae]
MISEDTLIRADVLAPFSAVHDVSVNMNMFNQLSLAFEATLSTFFRSYHKSNVSVVFCILEFAFPWVTSITCYVFEHMGQFDAIPRFLLFEASNVAAWLMLSGLAFVNRLFYRQHSVGNILQKFETAVQIRTLSMLNLLAVITGIRNCITVGILLMILFYFTPRCQFHAARTVAHFFDLTVAVYSAFFMVPLLFVNREFGRQFDGLLRRRSVVGVSDKEVRNVIGQRLIVQHDQAAHFGDLKNQWDAMATAQAKRKTI